MHAVGDILYILSNKKRNVVPVQVVEQIVRRSLEGENVSFKVALPGKGPAAAVDLHAIDGDVYKTLTEARRVLYEQASDAINGLLATAAEVSKSHFGVDPASQEPSLPNEPPVAQSPPGQPQESESIAPALLDFTAVDTAGEVRVQMPDGTYATVSMPEVS